MQNSVVPTIFPIIYEELQYTICVMIVVAEPASDDDFRVLAAYYIEQSMDGAQAVLDHYDLDITLADLGFVNYK